jgi:hypothetical protein
MLSARLPRWLIEQMNDAAAWAGVSRSALLRVIVERSVPFMRDLAEKARGGRAPKKAA